MTSKINKLEAVVLSVFLIGAMLIVPVSALTLNQTNTNTINDIIGDLQTLNQNEVEPIFNLEPFKLDRTYIIEEPQPVINNGDNDDAGYKRDAGDEITRASVIFPGEMIDDWPGRGNTGKLSATDGQDWYLFSVCDGQDIDVTMTPPSLYDFDIALWDEDKVEVASSSTSGSATESFTYTATYTGRYFFQILYVSGASEGQYTFSVALTTQNDAGSGDDAGDDFASATSITAGLHSGYLDMNDEEDWYKFNVNSGQGIHFYLDMKNIAYYSDFDIYLYNPSGDLAHYESYYYDDELLYPADVSGEWRARIKIFPGYTDIPQPTEWDYWTYGSGAYELEFILEGSALSPPGPIPQPDITPIAQTFMVLDDPDSNNDEYGYLASIPACNYLEGGDRYLAPIVYTGDDTLTNWYGDVDDTTGYLLEDWNTYLSLNGKTAVEYNVLSDPCQAAADIATNFWTSSDLAVVAVDGSTFEDTVDEVISRTRTLARNTEEIIVPADGEDIITIGDFHMYILPGPFGGPFVGTKWGAVNISIEGSTTEPSIIQIFPKFMSLGNDWWPGHEEKHDTYYPITNNGVWAAGVGSTGTFDFKITKYEGHRYNIRVTDDAAIKATVTTSTPEDLMVFLVDPQGHIRAPDPPYWNGGEINPIHEWNGIDDGDPSTPCGPYRDWNPPLHTEFTAEALQAEEGTWTAIVVPRNAAGSPSIEYTISVEVTKISQKRANAAISAANAAVIASQEHVPLLFVNEDGVPTETENAFTSLGVNNVIFVESGGIGADVRNDLPNIQDDLVTMQEIVDYIKAYPESENYITITSLKSGDGYFAPSAMLAAYHAAPVLRFWDAGGTEASETQNTVIVGYVNQNMYVMDPETGEIIYSVPEGYNPTSPQSVDNPEGTVYLGSSEDTIMCVNAYGDIVWSSSTEYAELENADYSLYLDMETEEVLSYETATGDENEPLPLFGAKSPGPAGMANRIDSWRMWDGDYYHGNRAPGHLPIHDAPVEQIGDIQLLIQMIKFLLSGEGELPPLGLDAKRYWNERLHDGIYDWIVGYDLDLEGQEAYVFVAPKKDIRLEAHAVMMGNNSYAGHIPGDTPAYTSAMINRNILYPAVIYGNPNRDVTTTQFMNWPDGGTWRTNDGVSHQSYSSRVIKSFFTSHGRTYDGHCLWDAHLERMNDGASVLYYSGHGTGGSGMSATYIQTDYSNYPEQIWYDAWRSYMYDNWKTPRDNGRRWYNPEPPNLYDFIHYKWHDQLFENLKSIAIFYMSCSTGQQSGPDVYLDHGAVVWYGNAGSGLCPQADLQDDWFFEDAMVYGKPIGPAFADTIWLHYRDFTTKDPTSMYGVSSLYGDEGITTIQCIFGDPNLIIYSPEWTNPTPIDSIYSGKTNAPNTPSVSGPTSTETGEENEYLFLTTDPNNDDVYYYIDWDDGTTEEWIGPYQSGEAITTQHTWDETGTYTINVKAKDITGLESPIATYTVEVVDGNNNQQQFNSQVFLIQTVKSFLQQTINIQNTILFGN